jgi:hypothetical protein
LKFEKKAVVASEAVKGSNTVIFENCLGCEKRGFAKKRSFLKLPCRHFAF